MKNTVVELRSEISELHTKMQELFKKAEEIRSYYKYQNTDSDSLSETFILDFNSIIGDTYGVICDLDEIVDWEDEWGVGSEDS